MPPILDVAIGVVFVFLLFSLVVSALNEVILAYLDRRARFLKEGITELFRDTSGKATITADKFFQHGLITALSRGKYAAGTQLPKGIKGFFSRSGTKGVPSYVPGKSFVLAVLDLVTEGKGLGDAKNLRGSIEKIGNKELKETLLVLYDDAKGNLDHFKANMENWYNESMDRVSGWYKRYAQQWLLALAVILAVACNVDSVRIIRALSLDPKLRDKIVQHAEDYAYPSRQAPAVTPSPAPEAPVTTTPTSSDSGAPSKTDLPSATDSEDKVVKFKRSLADLEVTGVPMGWNDGPSQELLGNLPTPRNCISPAFWYKNLLSHKTISAIALWLGAIVGWVVTGLAASLGAPFWFDMLNRFIDIRGVGRAPEESDTTAPKKPATGVESYVVTGDSLTATGGQPAGAAQQTGVAEQQGSSHQPSANP
jgi:hypothetical protein